MAKPAEIAPLPAIDLRRASWYLTTVVRNINPPIFRTLIGFFAAFVTNLAGAAPIGLVITHANPTWDRNEIAKPAIEKLISLFRDRTDAKIYNVISKDNFLERVSRDSYIDYRSLPKSTRFIESFQGELLTPLAHRTLVMSGGYFDNGCLQTTFAHAIALADWRTPEPIVFHFVTDAIYAGNNLNPYPNTLEGFAKLPSLSNAELASFTVKNLELGNPFKGMTSPWLRPADWNLNPGTWFLRWVGVKRDLHPPKKDFTYEIYRSGTKIGSLGSGPNRVVINYLSSSELEAQIAAGTLLEATQLAEPQTSADCARWLAP